MYYIICFLIGAVIATIISALIKKDCSEYYNKGFNDSTKNTWDKYFLTTSKKVVHEVIDDKLNALKEDYEPEKGIFHMPIKLDMMKLENIKDEICVALDDEFLPKQRA